MRVAAVLLALAAASCGESPVEDYCEDAQVELWIAEGGVHAPALTGSFSGQLLDWLETQRRTTVP